MAELNALGVLGENVVKEYGERLVKNINSFIATENLKSYIDKRPPKRHKTSDSKDQATKGSSTNTHRSTTVVALPTNGQDEFDEFETGIDFGAIALPGGK